MKKFTISIDFSKPIGQINKNIYGHFAEHLGRCIYEGFWVGKDSPIPNINGIRKDVIEALKRIKIPVLRWPGGCFADDYHWRDGIGPTEKRPIRINRWWNSTDSNHFGTHEFLELCKLLECEPYICGNVGSGTVQEMSDWIEYLNCDLDTTLTRERARNGHPASFEVKYWGVGNENWGCGGAMSPQYYANEYRRYSTYCSDYGDHKLFKIACGPNAMDFGWTDKFFAGLSGKTCQCESRMYAVDGFAMHYYCGSAGTATEFTETDWYYLLMKALAMEELIEEHRRIMDKYDPKRKIGLICDEWGTWHPEEKGTTTRWLYQQNTMRDAVIAALTLNIFNQNADKIIMANIAQTINVLQSVILTDGPKIILTPTFFVYELYAPHQEGMSYPVDHDGDDIEPLSIPRLHVSCSQKEDIITISIVNTHVSESLVIEIPQLDSPDYKPVSWKCIKGDAIQAHNTFEDPNRVRINDLKVENQTSFELSPASVNVLQFQKTN